MGRREGESTCTTEVQERGGEKNLLVHTFSSPTLNFFIIWGSVNLPWTTVRGMLSLEAMAAWLTMTVPWGLWW